MRNWFDLITPHEDIRNGHFDESVFAADLGDVVAGRAKPDYQDPYAFYRKTYLTRALGSLLQKVHGKLAEGVGPSVVQLKTPFGGGKTHSLVLVWHYLNNGGQIAELLPDGVVPMEANVASLVGTAFDPLKGRDSDGVHRRTVWGELAYQLGGVEAYRVLEEHDRRLVAPGKDVLHPLLEGLQPFVVLLDEVLEYIVKARGIEAADGTLGAQTLAFLKALTDTVSVLDRGLVLATLPASDQEDFGDLKQHNLDQLEKVFGRVESIETPVEGEEVYSIIRRRLFESVKDEAAVRAVIEEYVEKYEEHKGELPPKVRNPDFRARMERSYPFHPDVVDALYEKWGTFSSFQRTRGALRLLANVVEDLYTREVNLDLILLGDLNLGHTPIRQEFLKHIGGQYESVIGSDIAGPEAKSRGLDRENKGWKHLAERAATAIFLHSFTADRQHAGATLPYVKLAVVRPETIPSLVTDVLQIQAREALWYLDTRGDDYFFSNLPNLNRWKAHLMAQLPRVQVREELERWVRHELDGAMQPTIWPRSSDDVPEGRALKLVVLDPDETPDLDALKGWVDRRGDGFRIYKNTLFFAVPDRGRYNRLSDVVREFLALREIQGEIANDERPGMQEKGADVQRQLKEMEEDFPLKVRELYRTAAVPRAGGTLERVDFGQPAVGRQYLDSWYFRELSDTARGAILQRPPSGRFLATKFLGGGEPVSVQAVVEQFYKDPGLPTLASESLLTEALALGVRDGAFGLGRRGADGVVPASVRFVEAITASTVGLDEDELLLPPEMAKGLKAQAAEASPELPLGDGETSPPPVASGADGSGTTGPSPTRGTNEPAVVAQERYERVALRFSGVPVSKIADVNRGVFVPLKAEAGEFTITVELEVQAPEGVPEKVIEHQVLETLRQLGAKVEQLERSK